MNVIYGSTAGLTAARNQIWTRTRAGIAGGLTTRAGFEFWLAAADVDGDRHEAWSSPHPLTRNRSVNVIYSRAGTDLAPRATGSGHKTPPASEASHATQIGWAGR